VVADGKGFDVGADVDHLAGEFMTEHRPRRHLQEPVTVSEMQIGSADPAAPNFDHNMSRIGHGDRALLNS
jgi:hypothetical protein